MTPEDGLNRLMLAVESILFVADEPVEIATLARIAGRTAGEIAEAVEAAAGAYQTRGLRIQRTGDAVQMVTAPEAAPYVQEFLGVDEHQRLSHAARETLAIIAYKQPITRSALEAIRGVDCDHTLSALRMRGLVEEVGRATTSGRPYVYGTTFRFLEHFGLEKAEDLPPLPAVEGVDPAGDEEEPG